MQRITSIDIFRAITMLLMIFVNDIPGLGETIPHWLHHAVKGEDMLGLSDVVFPCFLFCVGLSIPFAIKNRIAKGDTQLQIVSHIAQRTTALLVMGLFASNSFNETASIIGIPWQLLKIISVIAFFMIWNLYPKAKGRTKKIFSGLQISGWVILVALAFVFLRTPPKQNEVSCALGFIPVGFSFTKQYLFHYLIIAACVLFPIAVSFLRHRNTLKLVANLIISLVIFYLFLFKGANADGLVGLRPGWWQILGLIGWTYVFASVIFIFTRNKISLNLIVWLLFTLFMIFSNSGLSAKAGIAGFIPGNGSFLSIAFAGIVAALIMQRNLGREHFGKLSSTYVAIAALMFVAATVAHKYFIISKLQETCTWIFYCTAISFAVLLFIYWITDIKDKKSWFYIIKPAGESTLTCYLIPSVWYCVVSLFAITYPEFTRSGTVGLIKSLVFAFVVIGVTWTLGKLKIKLKI